MQKGKRQPIYSNLLYRNLWILVYLCRSIKVDCILLHERHVREEKKLKIRMERKLVGSFDIDAAS